MFDGAHRKKGNQEVASLHTWWEERFKLTQICLRLCEPHSFEFSVSAQVKNAHLCRALLFLLPSTSIHRNRGQKESAWRKNKSNNWKFVSFQNPLLTWLLYLQHKHNGCTQTCACVRVFITNFKSCLSGLSRLKFKYIYMYKIKIKLSHTILLFCVFKDLFKKTKYFKGLWFYLFFTHQTYRHYIVFD